MIGVEKNKNRPSLQQSTRKRRNNEKVCGVVRCWCVVGKPNLETTRRLSVDQFQFPSNQFFLQIFQDLYPIFQVLQNVGGGGYSSSIYLKLCLNISLASN